MYNSFNPGKVWLDTDGKRIQAHGGSIFYENGTYYWYGENKEKTDRSKEIWHWGIKCYKSTDLYNWEDMGIIIPPDLDDETSPLHPSCLLDRPHIIYNVKTKKYVCWIKLMGWFKNQDVGFFSVLTADSILGPYTLVNKRVNGLGMSCGDFDLVVASDGKAYNYFERAHFETICADLNEDYTDFTGYYTSHLQNPFPPYVREATSHFIRKGKHYLVTSGTTGYFPNPSEIAEARGYHGPYENLGVLHRGDPSNTSFHSQISCIFKVPGKKDLYIAMADRWLPEYTDSLYYEECRSAFEKAYDPDINDRTEIIALKAKYPHEDTSVADYVWLPLRFEEGKPYIVWHDEWKLEDFE